MTMKKTTLRMVAAGVAGLVAAAAVIGGGSPGVAGVPTCERSVAIDPQVTVSEAAGSLTFVVHTGGCAAPGEVSYQVFDGTATRPADFQLGNGLLRWAAGDMSPRRITALIRGDILRENVFETFSIALVQPTLDVRIAGRPGLGRIFDDDIPDRLATLDSRICLVSKDGCADGRPAGGTGLRTFEPGLIIDIPFVVNGTGSTTQTVSFETIDGTLLAGVDYVPAAGTVTIPPGVTIVFVPVTLMPNALTQNGGYLNIHMSEYSGGGVVDGAGQLTVWG